MKKKVEKDKRIEELEKHGGGIKGDEVIANKEELQYMKYTIAQFKKVSSGDSADLKMVVIKNNAMLIQIGHYNHMKKRCLELEKMVKESSGDEGVLVHEKCLKTLEAEIKHIRKDLSLIAEGKYIDETMVDHTNTPRKRRANQSNQARSKTIL